MADIERLCDLANNASNLARMSDRLDDHADASKAHRRAFETIQSDKGTDRPSLAQTHLEQAARHDKIANDADSYEQKEVVARAASKKADKTNDAGDHGKAAAAHTAAGSAYRAQNKIDKGRDPWMLQHHADRAKRHTETAEYLKKIAEE